QGERPPDVQGNELMEPKPVHALEAQQAERTVRALGRPAEREPPRHRREVANRPQSVPECGSLGDHDRVRVLPRCGRQRSPPSGKLNDPTTMAPSAGFDGTGPAAEQLTRNTPPAITAVRRFRRTGQRPVTRTRWASKRPPSPALAAEPFATTGSSARSGT